MRAAEIGLAADRARALEALAASQQRQVEVEQLAAAGTKAASCAHDMSNPLASMRCNLDWLREAAEQDRLEADRGEVLEVIQETRECLDRLGHQLQDFRTIARTARAHARQLEALPGAGSPARPAPDRAAGE
ncbi:MAG: histidine kinase dimerization/phospho-acceptor domain-containing protein [Anaeromyxobacteraceae bacterium]